MYDPLYSQRDDTISLSFHHHRPLVPCPMAHVQPFKPCAAATEGPTLLPASSSNHPVVGLCALALDAVYVLSDCAQSVLHTPCVQATYSVMIDINILCFVTVTVQ